VLVHIRQAFGLKQRTFAEELCGRALRKTIGLQFSWLSACIHSKSRGLGKKFNFFPVVYLTEWLFAKQTEITELLICTPQFVFFWCIFSRTSTVTIEFSLFHWISTLMFFNSTKAQLWRREDTSQIYLHTCNCEILHFVEFESIVFYPRGLDCGYLNPRLSWIFTLRGLIIRFWQTLLSEITVGVFC